MGWQRKVLRVDLSNGTPSAGIPVMGTTSIFKFDEKGCQSVSYYGNGCAGTGGLVPKFTVSGCPSPGGTVSFEIMDGLAFTNGAIFIGLSRTSLPIGGGCTFLLGGFLLGERARLKGDAAGAANSYSGTALPLSQAPIEAADLVIDALFGAGLARALEGEAAGVVERLNGEHGHRESDHHHRDQQEPRPLPLGRQHFCEDARIHDRADFSRTERSSSTNASSSCSTFQKLDSSKLRSLIASEQPRKKEGGLSPASSAPAYQSRAGSRASSTAPPPKYGST